MKRRKIFKYLLGGLFSLILLPLLLMVAIYLPPVQRWAVQQATEQLEESTGLSVRIAQVRLSPWIDLELGGVIATDAERDTLLQARNLKLDVAFCPLFSGRADVNSFALLDAKINTKEWIPDVRVRGRLNQLTAKAHGADWKKEHLRINQVLLEGADCEVSLADTAQKDSTATPVNWRIDLDKMQLRNTALRVAFPGDSLHLAFRLGQAQLQQGHFDLGQKYYAFQRLSLQQASAMMNQSPRPLPHEAICDVRNLGLVLETLSYDSLGHLRCQLTQASLQEAQRGIALKSLSAKVEIDKEGGKLTDAKLYTAGSKLQADAQFDWKALESGRGGSLQADLKGELSADELLRTAQAHLPKVEYDQLLQYTKGIFPTAPIPVTVGLVGNVDHLSLRSANLSLPRILELSAQGHLKELLVPQRKGYVTWQLKAHNLKRFEHLIPPAQRTLIALPQQLTARGNLQFEADDYRLQMNLQQGRGQLNASALVNPKNESYAITADLHRFPIAHFLKGQPITPFTGKLSATGQGFDPTALRANLVAKADIRQLHYGRYPLSGIQLAARMRGGDAVVDFTARNPLLTGKGQLVAHLQRGYAATVDFDLDHLNVQRLTQGKDSLIFGAKFTAHLQASPSFNSVKARGNVSRIRFITPLRGLMASDMNFVLRSAKDSTMAWVKSGDLDLQVAVAGHYEHLMQKGQQLAQLVERQIKQRNMEQEALKRALPEATLRLTAGNNNPIASLLHYHKTTLQSLAVDLSAHPSSGLNGYVRAGRLKSGELLIDTLFSSLKHEFDGLRFLATIRNHRQTNPKPFTATLRSSLLHNGLKAELAFADKEGDLGLQIGTHLQMEEDGVSLSFFPQQPIVAYRRFDINADNSLFLGKDRTVRANIDLIADDGTGLQIYSQPTDSVKNDITLSLKHLNLAELSNVLPYLPRLSGRLNGDFHIIDNYRQISAMGMVEALDFSYEGSKMGRLGAEFVYLPLSDTEHQASAYIMADGKEVGECSGTYFAEGEGHFEGTAQLRGLPLELANGFLEGTQMALRGMADGVFAVRGTADAPVINGELELKQAHLYSKAYGVDFTLDEQPVHFSDSRLLFDNYTLRSTGDNALTLNGHVDMRQPSAMALDLSMKAKNFLLVNAPRLSESAVFGKVAADFDATVRGKMDRLLLRGSLNVLPQTDVTYILTNSPLNVSDELTQLVTFVDFSDTLQTITASPQNTLGLDVAMNIRLQPGARYHCYLSHNGESYVDVSGEGNLAFRMPPLGEMRLTGRLDIDEGKMNYALPLIPLRTFTLEPGSFVEFTGAVMNPKLNISARDRMRTIVTENERQRAVLFNVGVDITRTLEDMGLEFVIESPEDLGLQNKLTAMGAEQRAKAAIAMLATGMYLTDDNLSAGGLKASSALNAFLQKEIQNLAGRALSTIDISFGLENGTSAAGTTTVDYSFQFSKRFLNDRMRVIVGGKVSTGADAQGSTHSFIDNIALEYQLVQGGSRYVRVFYDREAHDPLEGSLMKTGAGLVLRRKTNTLGELFLFRRKREGE